MAGAYRILGRNVPAQYVPPWLPQTQLTKLVLGTWTVTFAGAYLATRSPAKKDNPMEKPAQISTSDPEEQKFIEYTF
jgi:hypothetical protein